MPGKRVSLNNAGRAWLAAIGLLAAMYGFLSAATASPAALDGKAIFRADDGLNGFRLYFTDGTAAGTFPLRLLNTRAYIGKFAVRGAIAVATQGITTGIYYVNFVNAAGEIGPNVTPPGNDVNYFSVIGGKLYWDSHDPVTSEQFLLESDGVTTNKYRTPLSSGMIDPAFGLNGEVYIRGLGCGSPACGVNSIVAWRLNGGHFDKAWIYNSSCCSHLAQELGPLLLFSNWDSRHGSELWATDGSPKGAYLVKDICPGPKDGIFGLTEWKNLAVGRRLIFAVNNCLTNNYELWASDGTKDGTEKLVTVGVASPDNIWTTEVYYRSVVAHNGHGFFLAENGVGSLTDSGLFETDGTRVGTKQLTPLIGGKALKIYRLGGLSYPIVGNWLYVTANTGDPFVLGLYRINTETHLVELVKAVKSGYQIAVGNTIVFTGWPNGGSGDLNPWMSDGSEANTHKIADINVGPGSSEAQDYTALTGN